MSLQSPTFCSPNATSCYTAVSRDTHGCKVACTGLYADVQFTEDDLSKPGKDMDKFKILQEQYHAYKSNYAKNIKFDEGTETLSKLIWLKPTGFLYSILHTILT